MHLFNRRAGDGNHESDLGFDPMALEGDAVPAEPDEAPALVPFTSDFQPLWATLSSFDADQPAHLKVLARVRDLEALGRRLDALLILRLALGESPAEVPLRLKLAELLEASGEADGALDELDAGLRVTRGDTVLLVHRGALLGRLGRHGEAEEELRNALVGGPDSVEARLHLGLSLLRRGRHADALPFLEQALALEPGRGDVAFHLGEAWYHVGQLERAMPNLMRATELAPADPRAYKLLGRLLDRMGRTEEAMVMHRKAREAGH